MAANGSQDDLADYCVEKNIRICICVLLGIPGSGKTSLMQSLNSYRHQLGTLVTKDTSGISDRIFSSPSQCSIQQKTVSESSIFPQSCASSLCYTQLSSIEAEIETERTQQALAELEIKQAKMKLIKTETQPALTESKSSQPMLAGTESSILEQDCDLLLVMSETVFVEIEYDSLISTQRQPLQMIGEWKQNRCYVVSAIEAFIQHLRIETSVHLSSHVSPPTVPFEIWQKFSAAINTLNVGKQSRRTSYLLMIDDNMHLHSMRYQFYKLAKKYQVGYCQIYVTCPCEVALERNRSRTCFAQIPEATVVKMARTLEPPDPAKYHWETASLTFNSSQDTDLYQIWKFVNTALNNPVQPSQEIDEDEQLQRSIQCSSNLVHQVDLILRKCVACIMSELKAVGKKEMLKDIGTCASKVKEKMLWDLKTGRLTLNIQNTFDIANLFQNPQSELFICVRDVFIQEMSANSQGDYNVYMSNLI